MLSQPAMLLTVIGPVQQNAVVRGVIGQIADKRGITPPQVIAQFELVVGVGTVKGKACVPSLLFLLLQARQHGGCLETAPVCLRLFEQERIAEREFGYSYFCHAGCIQRVATLVTSGRAETICVQSSN